MSSDVRVLSRLSQPPIQHTRHAFRCENSLPIHLGVIGAQQSLPSLIGGRKSKKKGDFMSYTDRREFLKLMGMTAAMSTLKTNIAKALAIPANNRTGTINDVEHIVILMQENRPFDHHFGTLRGVRGFSDPR